MICEQRDKLTFKKERFSDKTPQIPAVLLCNTVTCGHFFFQSVTELLTASEMIHQTLSRGFYGCLPDLMTGHHLSMTLKTGEITHNMLGESKGTGGLVMWKRVKVRMLY